MNKALKILTQKKLGVLIVRNNKNQTKGIITDGQVRRYNQNNKDLFNSKVSKIMTKNPISVEKDMLAARALNIMNNNKITSLCVHNVKKKLKTIGVLHIHNILEANIS
jgi:arabinose-5-phosphate isomerase